MTDVISQDNRKVPSRKDSMSKVLAYRFPATATYPKGVGMDELIGMVSGSERVSTYEKCFAAIESGVAVFLVGRPGVGKSSIVRTIADVINAEYIQFGVNAAPTKFALPGLVREQVEDVEIDYIDYVLEERLKGAKPKVLCVEEPNRMMPAMQQMLLEVVPPPHRIAGNAIENVVGVFLTGNRVEDGIEGLDPALSTRVVTIKVTAETTGWKVHVALAFPDTDLTEVYRVHDKFDPVVREQVSPRKFEKIVRSLLTVGSGWPALAMIDSQYEKFTNAAGEDVTQKVLDDIARALGVPNRDAIADPVDAVVRMLTDHGQNCYVESPPGGGKTSFFEDAIRKRRPDAMVRVISMANAAPDDWSQSMLVRDELRTTLLRFFADPSEEKYLICDEIYRAPDDVKDMLLEVLQEHTISGLPANVRAVLGLNNPREVEGYVMDVGIPDTAQADRFALSIKLGPQDIPWASYLLTKYGQTAEHFVEWWKTLPARDQLLYPPRVLEMAIRWWSAGMPLADTRPYYDGLPLDISFHELERALADRPLVKIRDVASRADEYAEVLAGPDGHQTEEHRAVFDAFDRADIVQLREHRKACEQLVPLLSQQSKINLIRSEAVKRRFWISIINGQPES